MIMDVALADQSRPCFSCPIGQCTRCGRPTEPTNICPSCTAVGSAAIALGSGPSSVKPPISNCAACRIALRVPPVPRANPYPVVMPITESTHAVSSTVAYTYHLYTPSPTSSSVQSVGTDAGGDRRDRPRLCMRFGCGARLPAHALSDVCEACVGPEFVCPSPAAVQNRVPRRATECTFPRPRELTGPVCTFYIQSVLREVARGTTVTMKRKDVEYGLEVNLVYPDDVPVAIQCASTTSKSMGEDSKPIQEEEEEPELVYPEDAAETVQALSSRPLISVSPPTTLHKFFTNGLQTIPTLQDLTAFTDKSPLRRCWMPGCNETLPAQTRMERCVKCSVGDWKRRKRTFMDTSIEEKEMLTVVTELSDVEDEDNFSPPPSPCKSSGNGLTGERGIRPIPGWDSDLTELSSNSELESSPEPGPAGSHGDTTGLTIRVPLLVTRLPPGASFQKCGNKKCNIALRKDHRWKTCDPCRRAQRMYQRIRLENKRRSILGIEPLEFPDISCRWRSLSPDMCETGTTLTPESSRPCSASQCHNRIPLPKVYRWKTCVRCRAKARQKARRKRDSLLETQHASRQPEVMSRFPAYQNREELLSSFDAQLKGFVEGQIMYLRAKLNENATCDQGRSESRGLQHVPMIFVFVGEYSIVTGQRGDKEGDDHDCDDSGTRDGSGKMEEMRQEVSSIVLDLERALRTKFNTGEAFAADKRGMIMRFTCSLELIAQLRPLTTTVVPDVRPSPASDLYANETEKGKGKDESCEDASLTLKPPPVPLVKTLSGELEAVTIPDESHRLFHGRRTVIRYCMLG